MKIGAAKRSLELNGKAAGRAVLREALLPV